MTTLYGFDPGSRIADPEDPRRVFAWHICRTWDDKGNVVVYDYLPDDERGIDSTKAHESIRNAAERATNRYLKRIRYGGNTPYFPAWTPEDSETPLPTAWHLEIVFDYGDHPETNSLPAPSESWPVRPDPFSAFRSGFEIRTYRRCARVLLFHHFALEPEVGDDCLVRSTDFCFSDQESNLSGDESQRTRMSLRVRTAAAGRGRMISTGSGTLFFKSPAYRAGSQ